MHKGKYGAQEVRPRRERTAARFLFPHFHNSTATSNVKKDSWHLIQAAHSFRIHKVASLARKVFFIVPFFFLFFFFTPAAEDLRIAFEMCNQSSSLVSSSVFLLVRKEISVQDRRPGINIGIRQPLLNHMDAALRFRPLVVLENFHTEECGCYY